MYNTSGWKDQLLQIDVGGNVPCDNEDGYCWCTNSVFNSYNSIGHPTVHKGSYLFWSNGKNLASYDGTSFTYASTGMRLTKGNTTYEYEGDKLIKETRGTTKIEYLHGANGIIGFRYSGRDFYYVKNALGDVTTVVDWYGDVFAKYVYDAFGNCTITQDTNGIGTLNPIRYRSYYYDTETGLYYLKTRYYDPEIGRFISPADTSALNPKTISGLNLYSYFFTPTLIHSSTNSNNSTQLSMITPNTTINTTTKSYISKTNYFRLVLQFLSDNTKALASAFENTFGSYIDLSYAEPFNSSKDWFFAGYETGIKTIKVLGDNSKPVSVFATNASEWWKFWEYQVGINLNVGKFSYTFSFGLGEKNTSIGWNGVSLDFQEGINKIGVGFSQTVGNEIAYTQYYIRTIPTLCFALVCIYAPYLIPTSLSPAFG